MKKLSILLLALLLSACGNYHVQPITGVFDIACIDCEYKVPPIPAGNCNNEQGGFCLAGVAGTITSPDYLLASTILHQTILVTKIAYVTDRAPQSCPRYAEFAVTDGTKKVAVAMTNGKTAGDSGLVQEQFKSGTHLKVIIVSGEFSGSCDTIAGVTNVVISYKIQ